MLVKHNLSCTIFQHDPLKNCMQTEDFPHAEFPTLVCDQTARWWLSTKRTQQRDASGSLQLREPSHYELFVNR